MVYDLLRPELVLLSMISELCKKYYPIWNH
jgi:hypothetical protein